MIQYSAYWLGAAIAILVFWMLPERLRYGFLGAASFAFLLFIEPTTAVVMLGLGILVYAMPGIRAGPFLERAAAPISIVLLLAYLGYFKYLPALRATFTDGYDFGRLLLPLGISYFTFKLIHYAIERGRGNLPSHDCGDFLSYAFLVPIFTAGPIQRFDLYMSQRSFRWSGDLAVTGITRIAHGLIKKFVFGSMIFVLIQRANMGGIDTLLNHLGEVQSARVGLLLVLTYLYVYMDFAGYTDIAIGTSHLFGIRVMENFNFPVFAPNIGNLWKRWHMSLANWCQSYIYMPTLGLTRNPYLSAFASFTVMGLWHGASLNWISWGLYNATGVAVFQLWSSTARRRKWRIVKTQVYRYIGYPLTFLFFAGSFAFTITDDRAGIWGAFRLLGKCVFIDLPAAPWWG